MIHPSTELKKINDKIGYGVFATDFIPKGTIVYVQDELDIIVPKDDPRFENEALAKMIDHYSYKNPDGDYVISWDIGKYVNHRCDFNTISTGYGFEIAVRDIEKGEQITDEYAVLNIEYEMDLDCGCQNCRGRLRLTDFDMYYPQWDEIVKPVIDLIPNVEQPLTTFMDRKTKDALYNYLCTGKNYKSIYSLKAKT